MSTEKLDDTPTKGTEVPGTSIPELRHIVARTDVSDITPDTPDGDSRRLRKRDRVKGSRREARSVRKVRSALAKLLETNAPKYQEWLERAAEKDPLKALVLLKDISEFYMPKLGRIEQTGTVEHKVSHFVPVTEREQAPQTLNGPKVVEAIDGEFTSLPVKP